MNLNRHQNRRYTGFYYGKSKNIFLTKGDNVEYVKSNRVRNNENNYPA